MNEVQELKVENTSIPGLLVLSLPVHKDARGWFKENWQRQKMIAAGLPDFRPVQNNVSFNAERGTTRGLHAEPWDKFVSVLSGKIFGAWVDLRPGDTFGASVSLQMGPEQAVFVPRGVANAFQTLTENTVYSYLVTEHWTEASRTEYSYVNLADPELQIPWPISLDLATVSAADRNHPYLETAKPVEPKKIAVLGGNGQLGRAFAQLAKQDHRLVILTREDLDLLNPRFTDSLDLSAYSHVINAAAMTAVDRAETAAGRSEAWQINAVAVRKLSTCCAEQGVPLVQVSTDYVFDGESGYVNEEDPLSPLGVYGQSKASGEQSVLAHAKNYVVRTSWVIGEGHNFVSTMQRLARRGASPTVVDDQIGRLTFANELASGILHLVNSASSPGIYHLQGTGEPTSWYHVARKVFELSGQNPDRIQATTTDTYAAGKAPLAPRPKNSTFDMDKLIATGFEPSDHLEALINYLS